MSDSVSVVYSSRLTRRDYKTLWLATLGGVLEFYDFIIFVFFANTIGALFFPPGAPDWVSQFQTFGIFAIGYFVRPLGGVLIDRKSTRLNSSHTVISYAVFCLKKKNMNFVRVSVYLISKN